jgi:hypothetical protein
MLKIEFPFHGSVLNHRHGAQTSDSLTITVTGRATRDCLVSVNGVEAIREGEAFCADVVLRDRETDVIAVSGGADGRREHRVRVAWDQYSRPRYRFSIDDNSFFLRDIAEKQYASLFDCFYLALLRDLHLRYGAKFVLNIYYTTGDDFNLTQFPDRYRAEWHDNAHWLRLAFHAHANEPDRPYQYAPRERLLEDWGRVDEQIVRFAGEATCSAPTVLHWGMSQQSVFDALHDRGVRVLSGYFTHRGGAWDVNYSLDDVRSEHLSRHDALVDFDSGIVFSKIDIVCNNNPLEAIVPTLAPLAADPNTAEVMDLFTHEQYFWPFYRRFIGDHAKRLDAAIAWVTEEGYEPVFFDEGYWGMEA